MNKRIQRTVLSLSISLMCAHPLFALAGDQKIEPVMPKIIESPPPVILPPPASPRGEVVQQSTQQVVPMTPDEIRRFRTYIQQEQSATYGKPPATRSRTFPVSLIAGASIPEVHIAPGYVASIVLIDKYGNPWPVEGRPAIGDPNLYSVIVPESTDHNVITVSALLQAGNSNLSVTLKGQSVPINIRLVTDTKEADLRADMQIQARGPNTDPVMANASGVVAGVPDKTMTAFVDGTPPKGAVELETSDPNIRVWSYSGLLYARTTCTILTPAPVGASFGSGGLRVYRFPQSPLILFTNGDDGAVQTLNVQLDAMGGQSNG
jgi:intracellular multiplication protein IcmK